MSILAQTTQPVNVMPIGDTFLVIDRSSGFVTLLRQGSESNVVGTLRIDELWQALQPKPVLTTWSGDYSDVSPDYMRDDYVGM